MGYEALRDIVAVARNVKDRGTRQHLRAAFVRLSNAIVDEVFADLKPELRRVDIVVQNGATLTRDEVNLGSLSSLM